MSFPSQTSHISELWVQLRDLVLMNKHGVTKKTPDITHTHVNRHAHTHARTRESLSLTCILLLAALLDLSPAHESQGHQ